LSDRRALQLAENCTDLLLSVLTDVFARLSASSKDSVTPLADRLEVGIIDRPGQKKIELIVAALRIVKDTLKRALDVRWPERRVHSAGLATGEHKNHSGADEASCEDNYDCRTDSHAPNDP